MTEASDNYSVSWLESRLAAARTSAAAWRERWVETEDQRRALAAELAEARARAEQERDAAQAECERHQRFWQDRGVRLEAERDAAQAALEELRADHTRLENADRDARQWIGELKAALAQARTALERVLQRAVRHVNTEDLNDDAWYELRDDGTIDVVRQALAQARQAAECGSDGRGGSCRSAGSPHPRTGAVVSAADPRELIRELAEALRDGGPHHAVLCDYYRLDASCDCDYLARLARRDAVLRRAEAWPP